MANLKKPKKKGSPFGWFASQRKKKAARKVHAHVSHEHDWQAEVPNLKLSRAFGIVLGLHVVVVVGILAHEVLKDDRPGGNVRSKTLRDGEAGSRVAILTDTAEANPTPHAPHLTGHTIPDGMRVYRVVSGDTPARIAAKVGTTAEEVIQVNGLNAGTSLYTGRELLVPISGGDVTDRRGQADLVLGNTEPIIQQRPLTKVPPPRDSVAARANGAATNERSVLKAQPYRPERVGPTEPQPQQRPPEPPAPQAGTTFGSVNFTEYTVSKGDTLYSLGRRFGVTPEAIQSANDLAGAGIRIGQTLRIPQ